MLNQFNMTITIVLSWYIIYDYRISILFVRIFGELIIQNKPMDIIVILVKKQDFNLSNRIIIGPGKPLRGGISESNQALHSYYLANRIESYIVSYSLQYPSFFFPGKKQTVDDVSDEDDSTLNLINTVILFLGLEQLIGFSLNLIML